MQVFTLIGVNGKLSVELRVPESEPSLTKAHSIVGIWVLGVPALFSYMVFHLVLQHHVSVCLFVFQGCLFHERTKLDLLQSHWDRMAALGWTRGHCGHSVFTGVVALRGCANIKSKQVLLPGHCWLATFCPSKETCVAFLLIPVAFCITLTMVWFIIPTKWDYVAYFFSRSCMKLWRPSSGLLLQKNCRSCKPSILPHHFSFWRHFFFSSITRMDENV